MLTSPQLGRWQVQLEVVASQRIIEEEDEQAVWLETQSQEQTRSKQISPKLQPAQASRIGSCVGQFERLAALVHCRPYFYTLTSLAC